MKVTNQQGVTLIELLIVMFLSIIALMAATTPFVGERSFWGTGSRQAEAQRSAQVVLRAIARVARQSTSFTLAANQITFTSICSSGSTNTRIFKTAGTGNSQFQFVDNCVAPALTVTLVDGAKSKVTQFTPTSINTKLVDIQLQIQQENQQSELLQTELYLRN